MAKLKSRVGEIYTTNEGYSIEIINYFNKRNYTIKFYNDLILYNIHFSCIKKGNVKNPNHKSVYGVGYLGVGKYNCTNYLKIYATWNNMLERCYESKYHEKRPTYIDCTVDEEWHNFQNFAKWYEENHKENYALDKDILFRRNKVYSPKTCCFVPQEINSLLVKSNSIRGKYPIGVCKLGSKFKSAIKINTKTFHLGLFSTPSEAFQAYKKAKETYLKEMAEKYKNKITEPTYRALINYKVEIDD